MFRQNQSVTARIREAIKPTPVKQRIEMATTKLRTQTNRLERTIHQMETRDNTIHGKCVQALEARDTQTATMYANECVEIRKMIKTSLKSQMCLEQAVLRLQTIEEFGDVASGMSMVKSVLGNIKAELQGKLPDIATGIGDVENSLEILTSDIGQAIDADGVYVLANDESARILKEADLVAEQKMSQKFPEIPSSLAGSTRLR